MGKIYRNNLPYGGFYTGPAYDVVYDPNNIKMKSTNTQDAIDEVATLLVSKDFNKNHISVERLDDIKNPIISVDNEVKGGLVLNDITNNIFIKNISIGSNPSTSNPALVVVWYDGTEEHTNYIDFTN